MTKNDWLYDGEWSGELGFTLGKYAPDKHEAHCSGELLISEENGMVMDRGKLKEGTTAIVFFCWECKRYWPIKPCYIGHTPLEKLPIGEAIRAASPIWLSTRILKPVLSASDALDVPLRATQLALQTATRAR